MGDINIGVAALFGSFVANLGAGQLAEFCLLVNYFYEAVGLVGLTPYWDVIALGGDEGFVGVEGAHIALVVCVVAPCGSDDCAVAFEGEVEVFVFDVVEI